MTTSVFVRLRNLLVLIMATAQLTGCGKVCNPQGIEALFNKNECSSSTTSYKTFLYVANELSDNSSAYEVGATGLLTPVPGSPFAAGDRPYSVSITRDGRFLYAVNYTPSTISAYSINASTGALTSLGAATPSGTNPMD